jgi:hypothetical protein
VGFYDSVSNFGRIHAPNLDEKCRQTAYTFQNLEKYTSAVPIFQKIDQFFKSLVPNRYKAQKEAISKINPKYCIPKTVFTTVTVNKNFRTAMHKDGGDYKEGFGNLLSTAFKYSPLGLMSNMVSSGIEGLTGMNPSIPEGLTGMNPLKEVGNMLGITSNEEPSSLKPKVGSDSAIPVKIVSGEMPTDMALQMKDATLKDKIPEAGGNTYVNAPSTVSYQNNSAGEEPSVPSENINIGDPYLMEAARGNFSMV